MAGRTHLGRLCLAALVSGALTGCAWVRTVWNESSSGESQELLAQARKAEQAGHTDRAALLLEAASLSNPDDAALHRELARFQIAQGERGEAVAHLRQAIRLDPHDAEGHAALARLFFLQGRLDDAERETGAALRCAPSHREALLLKAALAEQRNRFGLALDTYHRVLCCDEENISARLRVAAIQLRSSRPERAAPLLRSICDDPQATAQQQADARWALGLAYGRNGRWEDAAAALAEASRARPMTADDWYTLAYARFRVGDLAGAQSDLLAALNADPAHTAAVHMAAALRTPSPLDRLAAAPLLAAPAVWQ
ncbi:MAG: tetratricopeptide repeat protein [Planctomycetaceae bacterium]